jgi:hypothetical protein
LIAGSFLLIGYWVMTAEPPPSDETPSLPQVDSPHVLVARFQLEQQADLTPGVLLRRERYLVDPVQVPRLSKAMTWAMLLVGLGGEEEAQRLGITDVRDPENPSLGISLVWSDAVPDLAGLLAGELAQPGKLAAILAKLDPTEPELKRVERALAGDPVGEPACAAEEAAALARVVLRQAEEARDSPQSLYVSYRGEVLLPEPAADPEAEESPAE